MAPVRTGVLVRYVSTAVATPVNVGTVPGTDTWLIKDLHVFNNGAGAATVQVQVLNAAVTLGCMLVSQSIAAGAIVDFAGLVAAGPTDSLWVTASAAGVFVWVTGADLPGHL